MKIHTTEEARAFAEEWVRSWNAHEIHRILSHYTEEIKIESRIAAGMYPGGNGRVFGKAAVRTYWKSRLDINPALEFLLLDVLIGVSGLTIYYENTANGVRAVEVMLFDEEGLVREAIVHHSK